jgi:peptide deformylase
MSVLPIRLFPDPVLRVRCRSADWNDRAVQVFIRDLTETLYAQPHGIGIAAPQVGEPKRIIVVDVSARDRSKHRQIMINPILRDPKGEGLSREGCMSLPDYTANVVRAARVRVQWWDERGARHEKEFTGIEGVCLQHEIDHLNGVLFLDRVSTLKTDVFPRAKRR